MSTGYGIIEYGRYSEELAKICCTDPVDRTATIQSFWRQMCVSDDRMKQMVLDLIDDIRDTADRIEATPSEVIGDAAILKRVGFVEDEETGTLVYTIRQ